MTKPFRPEYMDWFDEIEMVANDMSTAVLEDAMQAFSEAAWSEDGETRLEVPEVHEQLSWAMDTAIQALYDLQSAVMAVKKAS